MKTFPYPKVLQGRLDQTECDRRLAAVVSNGITVGVKTLFSTFIREDVTALVSLPVRANVNQTNPK